MWHLWIWDQPTWRVLATYSTFKEARDAGKHSADPADTWIVCAAGSARDTILRQNCTTRQANVIGGRIG
jgi:hypothetical protein